MTDQAPTTVTTPLILELIKTITENTDELHKLRAEVATLTTEKRALTRDVACMSRGVAEFRENFEPYLQRAVEEERIWQERRRRLTTAVLKWGLFGVLSFFLWSARETLLDLVHMRR